MADKNKGILRRELNRRYAGLWGPGEKALRPPVFPGCNQAAERLRRLPALARAQRVALMPDPVLLQARINVLNLGKELICATPGLKQGLVLVSPQELTFDGRSRGLSGHSLIKSGRHLRQPGAKLGRVDMLIGAVLAADRAGNLLGDGRGLFDLTYHLLSIAGVLSPQALVTVLAAEEQIVDDLPSDLWDVGADLVVTPQRTIAMPGGRPQPSLENLPPALAGLPVVLGIREKYSP